MAFTIHHENPDVMTQDNFLTDAECDHFIKWVNSFRLLGSPKYSVTPPTLIVV